MFKQWFPEDKNNKQIFKYFHFLQYILIVSAVASKKIIEFDISELRKLINLLELMEISGGFKKICKSQQVNIHLIASEKLIKQLERQDSLLVSPEKNESPFHLDLNDKFLENYGELRKKFISFCIQGETIGSSSLTHKKAVDILKSLDIGLKQSEI